MRNLLRLFRLFLPDLPWLLFGALLAAASLTASIAVFTSVAMLAGSFAAGAVLRTMAAGRVVSRYTERLITHDATFRTLARLRLWLFARLVPLAPLQLGMQRGGDLLTRLTSDIDALDGFYLRLLIPVCLALVATTGALLWLSTLDIFTALGLLLVTVWALALLGYIARQAGKHTAAAMEQQAQLRTDIIDGVEGLAELTACGAGHQQASVIARSTSALVREQLAVGRAQALATAVTQLLHAAIIILLLVFLWPLVQAGTLPALTLLLALMGYLAGSELLPGLQNAFMAAPRLAAASQRVFAIADLPAAISEPAAPLAIPADLTLTLEEASLNYGRSQPALDNISLTIKPHERVAIMGGSGAGKSSLALLLLKFALPDTGILRVGGTDLTRMDGDVWRQQIGYLSQHTRLLAGTLADNLRLAKPVVSRTEMWAALEAAEMADFVHSLPDGLETWIGEDGLQLSGGQARRLALAIIVIRNAPIWLLDEPTEGLDAATANAVLEAIRRLTEGRTLLFITHDAGSIAAVGATRLILLENGKISADSPV